MRLTIKGFKSLLVLDDNIAGAKIGYSFELKLRIFDNKSLLLNKISLLQIIIHSG